MSNLVLRRPHNFFQGFITFQRLAFIISKPQQRNHAKGVFGFNISILNFEFSFFLRTGRHSEVGLVGPFEEGAAILYNAADKSSTVVFVITSFYLHSCDLVNKHLLWYNSFCCVH
jgi:hypothetical protein